MGHAHNHNHNHGGHCHHPAPKKGQKVQHSFAIAASLNLLFTLAEAIFALLSHSMSLLADAGHNLADVVGLLGAWVATWLLTRPSSERYSYGYKRTSILAAIFNALLLTMSCTLIVYESVIKLLHPTSIETNLVMLIAGLGILINGGTALLFMKDQADDLNIRGAYLHLASDALISIGVVLAALVIHFTAWYWLDPVVALIIVGLIFWGTWSLLSASLNLLLDAVPGHIPYLQVEAYFLGLPGVTALHDLHIWGLSTQEVALTVHLIMPEIRLSDEAYLDISHTLKEKFHIDHVTVQVEQGNAIPPCLLVKGC